MTAAVLVVGGGVTGLHAALELDAAGVPVVIVEQGPILGGKRAAWLSGDAGLDPRLGTIDSSSTIEVLTLAQLQSLSGAAREFTASIRQRPRFVNENCTRCNHCVPVCPQAVANEYDAGLTFRKAIHSPLPHTIPDLYVIDIDSCLNVPPNYLPCQRCVEVCDDQAIDFNAATEQVHERAVAAVIIATGFADDSTGEHSKLAEFGYGAYPDVVSNVELQRMLEDPGPSGGFAVKPSNEAYPDSVLLLMTELSSGSTWVACNHLRRLAEQDIELSLLLLASPSEAAELDELKTVASDCGASLNWGSFSGLEQTADGGLRVRYLELPGGYNSERQVDMLVLSSEVHADAAVAELAQMLQLSLDPRGYISASRPGVYVAGGALGTVGVEAGAAQARQAVQAALQHVAPEPPTAEPGAPMPDWSELPADRQQQYLEQMLQALLRLGEGKAQ